MYSRPDPSDPFQVELTPEERQLIVAALNVWGGPTRLTAPLALAFGFDDVTTLYAAIPVLREQVQQQATLTRVEWARVVALVEVGFASSIFGAGVEWEIVTGINDHTAIELLRAIQGKFPAFYISGRVDSGVELAARFDRSSYGKVLREYVSART